MALEPISIRLELESFLQGQRYQVLSASSPREVQDLAASHHPRLIVLSDTSSSIRQPSLLPSLRQQAQEATLIVVAEEPCPQWARQALQDGVDEILTVPVNLEYLGLYLLTKEIMTAPAPQRP